MSTSDNPSPDRHVNAVVMPGWDDEFDLTEFFRRLDPLRFKFRDNADLPWVREVFKIVQGNILRWVALYRGLVRSANGHPEAMTHAVFCVRRMGSMDWSAYRSWFSSPNKDFEEISPHDWFTRNSLDELCPLLGGKTADLSVPQKTTSGVFKAGTVVRPRTTISSFSSGEDLPRINVVLAQLKQLANSELEPPFYLSPLLNRCQPQNQKFTSAADGLLASEVFMVLEGESFGWLKLYHCVLDIARERAGMMPYIVLCLQRLQSLGRGEYFKWFQTPQDEFGGISPECFFVREGYINLAVLLVAGQAGALAGGS